MDKQRKEYLEDEIKRYEYTIDIMSRFGFPKDDNIDNIRSLQDALKAELAEILMNKNEYTK
jgi:hypothetical protein